MSQHCAFCGNKHLSAKTTRYIHQQADVRRAQHIEEFFEASG